MSRIAIIAAMADELKPLVRGWRRESRNGVALWRRRHDEGEWIAACAGIGVDAATHAFAEIEKEGAINLVLSAGWAGALCEDFAAGRAYCVSAVIDAVTGERFPVACRSGGCWLATSHRVADQTEKRRLVATYGAGLVDMEAAGVARLAATRGIPFYCVKAVTDGFSDQLPDFNSFISIHGKFQVIRFILFALLRPWHWPTLWRMGQNGRRAARGMRDSLLDILESGR